MPDEVTMVNENVDNDPVIANGKCLIVAVAADEEVLENNIMTDLNMKTEYDKLEGKSDDSCFSDLIMFEY